MEASYEGPPLDGTYQPISEAPHWQGDGETVDVVDGQSTRDDWGWSA